jgi:predicted  nucleic acid-binding Zn-ribbon protein
MSIVMCEACGRFRPGRVIEDVVLPIDDECPDCGASEFQVFQDGEQ